MYYLNICVFVSIFEYLYLCFCIWLPSWRLFSVPHLFVPHLCHVWPKAPTEIRRTKDLSKFLSKPEPVPGILYLVQYTWYTGPGTVYLLQAVNLFLTQTFCSLIYQGSHELGPDDCCLFNQSIWSPCAERHFYYGNDGRELVSASTRTPPRPWHKSRGKVDSIQNWKYGYFPSNLHRSGWPGVKHEIHTNKIIGSLLLKRWQNESNYGSFCHRPGIIWWSRALLVIGRPQCLRPQGWSITGKTRLVWRKWEGHR